MDHLTADDRRQHANLLQAVRRYLERMEGHEVALHGEFVTTAEQRFGSEEAAAMGEKEYLAGLTGQEVEGVCMHGGELRTNTSTRTRDAIEAHLTVVFTALAVARFMQTQTGVSLQRIITTLRPLREFTGRIGGHQITFPPEISPEAQHILDHLQFETPNSGH